MKEYLVNLSSHHNSEASDYNFFYKSDATGNKLVAEVLAKCVSDYIGDLDKDPNTSIIADHLETKNEHHCVKVYEGGEELNIVFWSEADNIGFGISETEDIDGTSKKENQWIKFAEWAPDQERLGELDKMCKVDLVDMILRQEDLNFHYTALCRSHGIEYGSSIPSMPTDAP